MLKKVALLLILLGLAFGALVLLGQKSSFTVQSTRQYPLTQAQVWRVLTNVERWPDWWPGAERAELSGSFANGSTIRLTLKGLPDASPARLGRVESPHGFLWSRAGVLSSQAGTAFRLEAVNSGVQLRIENFIYGPQAILARITGEEAFRKYQLKLLANLDRYLHSKRIARREKD
ncbi:MAG: SRPBCC family protein [Geopsychrobacter sp.]|nr:SRPBCC family protein [Geopsychrobacter sp.]